MSEEVSPCGVVFDINEFEVVDIGELLLCLKGVLLAVDAIRVDENTPIKNFGRVDVSQIIIGDIIKGLLASFGPDLRICI